jgi:hypothetical protein
MKRSAPMLSADFGNLAEKVNAVEQVRTDWVCPEKDEKVFVGEAAIG